MDDCGEVLAIGVLQPAFEGDAEHGDARLRGQARRGLGDAAIPQGRGRTGGQRGELVALALLELGVGGDDALASAGERAALSQERADDVEAGGDRVDRGGGLGRAGNALREPRLELIRAGEEDLALVGEMPEERALGQPGTVGDLGDGGLLKAALVLQLEGRLGQPALGVGLPSAHGPSW